MIISIALFLIYSKSDEETNDTKPITSQTLIKKEKNHDVLKNDDKTNKIESN